MREFVITEICEPFSASDPRGKRYVQPSRATACFIVTVRGKIRFSYAGGAVVASALHPVFLPRGLGYVNECLEDSFSYVFNFQVSAELPPAELTPIPEADAEARFAAVRRWLAESMPLAFSELYALAHTLLCEPRQSDAASAVDAALAYMRAHYSDPTLRIGEIAASCYISEVYLRRLMQRVLGVTPLRALTELRMKQARLLATEKRPIKEIAPAVGYGDVFSFSRAYKQYYGKPPSES